ncbi:MULTISPECIES: c-type cytochrome [Vibrio]|jgi:cytochrome c5|uniref:Cytochrome C n=1 Tax=Vibrio natriegens NBRC 15636 = ATCC 14048 = DSM 759 TaxID=1219067 RepID=A0AAN1CX42_VIBNA|nr:MULTISPECIES: cytochrome c5 family protein [Vibrio]MEE3878954.1 cytochrome c5 family protein [Vibrio sp. YYF0003]WMN87351.1 cytochrome c5 family protein [Vibrio parahaemolyticus]AEX20539.1 cytochrome c5 [Vibrio sp. EJY3]ALR17292.1 cytochrome C [Vibrio natriegens NBRC 15636 = ATCC 14048 = DSM 759]ANQ13941.1 cytochrome C [Vibrio natriegens NBRC 15636 = ATCC 14048 = DSM 759]
MDMSRQMISVLFAALTFSTAALASDISQSEYDAIAERIKPVGDVYLAGSEPVKAEPTGPRDGATVYGTFCIACHASGVNGAPKIGNADEWAPRIAQGKDVLIKHALEGFNAMPAKGTCMDCSDDEITAAIDHMIAGL